MPPGCGLSKPLDGRSSAKPGREFLVELGAIHTRDSHEARTPYSRAFGKKFIHNVLRRKSSVSDGAKSTALRHDPPQAPCRPHGRLGTEAQAWAITRLRAQKTVRPIQIGSSVYDCSNPYLWGKVSFV